MAFFPLGETAIPKGSLVIRIILPAGVTYLPLGKTETPFSLIVQN